MHTHTSTHAHTHSMVYMAEYTRVSVCDCVQACSHCSRRYAKHWHKKDRQTQGRLLCSVWIWALLYGASGGLLAFPCRFLGKTNATYVCLYARPSVAYWCVSKSVRTILKPKRGSPQLAQTDTLSLLASIIVSCVVIVVCLAKRMRARECISSNSFAT